MKHSRGKHNKMWYARILLRKEWEPKIHCLFQIYPQETLVLCYLLLSLISPIWWELEGLGGQELCIIVLCIPPSSLFPSRGPQPGLAQGWCLTNIGGFEDAGQDFGSVKFILFHDHSLPFALCQPSHRGMKWRAGCTWKLWFYRIWIYLTAFLKNVVKYI